MNKNYDVVVLGGGVGGYVAAIHAAKRKLSVALVEEDLLGGTCLNRGCIPTKALLESSNLNRTLLSASEFGIDIGGNITPNFKNAQKRKDGIVNQLRNGVEMLMKMNKIDVYAGRGSVMGPSIFSPVSGTISVTYHDTDKENDMLIPKKLIIATGSSIRSIDSLPIDEKDILSSNGILDLKKLPKSITIVGGGVIGIEWASLMHGFGVAVTVVEFADQILPNEDASIARALQKELEAQGIVFHLNTEIIKSEIKKDRVILSSKDAKTFESEKVLVAIGRQPNVKRIGLENTSIKFDNKGIHVNEYYQTGESHIYAIGDCINTLQLAHVAMKEAEIAIKHAHEEAVIPLNYDFVPRCVYTTPEVACIGPNKKTIKEKTKTGRFSFNNNARALIHGTGGYIEVISSVETEDLIAVNMIGPGVTELIQESALALELNATPNEIGQTIHAHPTLAEVLMEAAQDVNKQSVNQ